MQDFALAIQPAEWNSATGEPAAVGRPGRPDASGRSAAAAQPSTQVDGRREAPQRSNSFDRCEQSCRFRRPLWPTLLIMLLAMTTIAAGPPVMRSGQRQPLRLSPGQVQSMLEMQVGPSVDAPSALLADYPSNTVLWSKAADEPMPMASTTKLMTALVALDDLSPDEIITVPGEALVGGASMGLEAGELVGVETLLYGALLPSGNDAAMTLAIRAEGSEADFVERMNAEATAWGLTQTNFVNPHGFDAPGHVSSARDLMNLARRVLDMPLLAQIVRTAQATVGGYQLVNTNELLTSYPGAYGVKTGTTDEAGEVLIAGAARTGGNALTVVMNSPDRYAETQRLLDFYFDHWQWSDPRLDHDALNRVTGPDGVHYLLRSPSRPLFLPRWQALQLRTYRQISFDAENKPSGAYEVWLGEEKLAETPITFIPYTPANSPSATPTPTPIN